MAHDVFISYASANLRVAEVVCTTLEANHIKCWMAPRNVLPGVEYAESIIDAIEQSRILLLILSSQSSVSPHVLREVNKAASESIPILSFIIEEVTLSKSLEYYLSTDHWLNAMTPPLARHIQVLAETVKSLFLEMDKKRQEKLTSGASSRRKKVEEFASRVRQETHEDILMELVEGQDKSLPDLIVDINGSGDYRRIQDAIDAARQGQRVIVRAGIYRERIEINNMKINLCGEGRESVKVISAYDSALYVSGKEKSNIQGINFNVSGAALDTPVCLLSAPVNMQDCRVTGGGIGVRLINTNPVLTGNMLDHNHIGILVAEGAKPSLNNNQLNYNQFGILFNEETEGTVSSNICRKNTIGIKIADSAKPVLEYNDCSENKDCGIAYFDNAAGMARKNNCKRNMAGIRVEDNAKPLIENNSCSENLESGLCYSGKKGGVARSNECIKNKNYGIQVAKKAEPMLESNQCNRNKGMGIAFYENSGGMVIHNTCSKNDVHGILIREQAQPSLEKNKCNDNREAGIAFFDNAAGYARNNTCRGNKLMDISVNGQATPKLG